MNKELTNFFYLLIAIACINSVVSFGIIKFLTVHSHESSLNVLKIPLNRIIEIDTSTTYECSANDLDSLNEIKTIKIIYK